MNIDLQNATLATLAVIGAVNAATIFKPDLDSRAKFIIALVVALLVGFVPADLATDLGNRIKDALVLAFASSGVYKLAKIV